ncbi:MAG: ribonuclease H-like domain-containing protein [Leptospiraceae bacterium]|nr:ribonuclease H-like domain-containing protein [Leptospiraceae bacterium]MCK6382224.1 ribonuclease H-like domain-containing protein [Leptospiraceae bacterium]NUM41615.1 ribonuclease H-like domain-containing protein [Leptospiraceae bacterium]
MIDKAFLHFKGVGKKNLEKLESAGFDNWSKVISKQEEMPFSKNFSKKLISEAEENSKALKREDIYFFAKNLLSQDKWRLLERYFDKITFLDIETEGLDSNSGISLIVCLHEGKLYRFLRNENLDEFLELLPKIQLLSTFNGSSFDLPVIQNFFRIGEISCPHVDLRWVCYHLGYKGGLKSIEYKIGIQRPYDLKGVDGFEAVILWDNWNRYGDEISKNRLIRYCAADVVSLKLLTEKILIEKGINDIKNSSNDIWKILDEV